MRRLHSSAVPGKQVKISGTGALPYVDLLGKHLYVLTTAVTSGATNSPAGSVAGDLAVTTNATGINDVFVSDGTHLVSIGGAVGSQANFVAALTGAGSGTANGALEAEGTVTTAGGNTYADAAVNAVFAKLENNIAEIATKQEAIRANLVAAGIMKSS